MGQLRNIVIESGTEKKLGRESGTEIKLGR